MTKDGVGFLSVGSLDGIGKRLSNKLISSSPKLSKHISYQIGLLEVIKYQSNRYDHLAYCDYELSYLSYVVNNNLLIECKNQRTDDINDFIHAIDSAMTKNQSFINSILKHIGDNQSGSVEDEDLDPILARFKKLESKSSIIPYSIESHKYTEIITGPQLHKLIESEPNVLLIDFRTKNEFNYNHINYSEVVNIDPSVVNSLLGPENQSNADKVTDQDFEDRLRLLLPDDQFARFLNRNKYELVVLYNLRYGMSLDNYDRFEILTDSLITDDKNGNISKNPFTRLVDIITYRNKYISSRLKRAPCFLSGGVTYWFTLYGEKAIAKTTTTPILSRPNASMSKYGSSSSFSSPRLSSTDSLSSISNGSPYLKNFGDYLGTAKQTKETPVSNPFITKAPSNNYYSPSSPLTPPKFSNSTSSTTNGTMNTTTTQPQQQRRRSSSSLFSTTVSTEKPKPEPKGPDPTKFLEQYATGLENLGNSCYMNCVLQCLGATPQLTKFFFPSFPVKSDSPAVSQSYRQHINVNNKLGTKGILTTNFVNLLMSMFSNSGSYFKPSEFKKIVGSLSPSKQFANFDQQDCIEFLNFLLDSLHEDLNQMVIANPKEKQAIIELTPEQEKTREFLPVRLASTIEWERYLKVNFSIIVDYFQGQYMSQLKCLECGLTSTTYNAFSILSLPIPHKLNNTSDISLTDCLQEFVQLELLDDDNKWHCPRCKRFTRSTKKITITRLPQVLIIHFKRFQISPMGYFSKMDNFIKYPVNEVLDLTSYWPEVGTAANDNLNSNDMMSKEKESQVLSTLPTRNQVPPFRYKLYGVANHYGNLTTGHYTAYVHKESDKKRTRGWCYFDDKKVTFNKKESEVLNKNAYCLFYQRI